MVAVGSVPLVRAERLSIQFKSSRASGGRPIVAVSDVDLVVNRGETLGLVGESGSGKTTIGRALLGLQPTAAGNVFFEDANLQLLGRPELRRMRRRMQMIFQDPYGSLDPRMRVRDIIAEPLVVHRLHLDSKYDRVRELLALVGLEPRFELRYPHQFSGGQRQRIGIARALAAEPDFIVCDEPVSALDVSIQAQILNLLTRLQLELGLTYLFIAHDLAVVRHISTRIAVMYLGKIVEVGPVARIYAVPGHPYTRALLSAIPIPDPAKERARQRVILTGDVPSPSAPPAGCRFHTRCWLFERLGRPDVCRTDPPTLHPVADGHDVACHWSAEAVESGVGVVPGQP